MPDEYCVEISKDAARKIRKIAKKNRLFFEIVDKKVQQIRMNPYHFKPLRGDMHGARRVHVDTSFVLTYEIRGTVVRILDCDHHDRIY